MDERTQRETSQERGKHFSPCAVAALLRRNAAGSAGAASHFDPISDLASLRSRSVAIEDRQVNAI
jgi:hypothetical protein